MEPDRLLVAAREAADRAIAPYSEFAVGAAIATDQDVYRGCNVEIANYSNSLHAEEVALVRALFEGERSFTALAVSAGPREGGTPCGRCRQTLVEFCPPELPVYVDCGEGYDEYTLGELLPAAFGPADLK